MCRVPRAACRVSRPQLLRANIRINRRLNSALKFGEVIIISTFIGTLGYLSLLANFNSPKNKCVRACAHTASLQ